MRKDFGAKPYTYPQPVLMIATYGEDGKPDVMNAAWGGMADTDKIFICLSAEHKTVKNILANKAFTVSMADENHLVSADYVGIESGNKVPDKLEKAGFHAVKSKFVEAPLIEELPMALECRLVSYDEETELMIGEIVNVCADEKILDENGNYLGMVSRRNLMSMQKKQIILVDHNEKSQAVDNINEAEILEIIDHHRLGSLETISPVYFRNQPLGCTSTIIYQMFGEKNIEIPQHIAGLLLSAILSDTLMFRSPTCTQLDILAAEALAKIAKVDIETHAKNMFKAGSDFKNKTTEEIFYSDFKIFHTDEFDFGVAQISAMSREELDKVAEKLRPFLKEVLGEKRIDMVYVMLTDILEESSRVIFEGHDAGRILADAFEREENENGILLEGIISRKKQLIPTLMNAMAEKV